MIWGAAAVIADAYDGLGLLMLISGVTGVRPPTEFLDRQFEEIRKAERLHAEEVRLEALVRGLTVEALLGELHTAKYAIVDLNDLADYQADLAWAFFEQGIIGNWDDAVRAIPPPGRPAASEYTGLPDEDFFPITSGIYAERPARSPKGCRPLSE